MLLHAIGEIPFKEVPDRLSRFHALLREEEQRKGDILSEEEYERLIDRFKREFEKERHSYGFYI